MTTLADLRQANLKEQKQRSPESAPAETASAAPPPAHESVAALTPPPALVVVETQAAPSPEAEQDARFFARIHDALAHKTTHPSSAKVTADMPPALFHRAKRYCLDHGNVTLRQVLLELLTAYLEEEGY
ncbi:MAG: hypothetical protein M3Y28_07990 [Armatimonadota bacterium]|nr:hypothetical protein [Armatimonadota bacterium]